MKKERKTKISKRYVRSTWNAKFVPLLMMQGEYLRKAGFKIGTECSVKIENGLITIQAI
jgi:precorrin isomerase